MTTNEIACKVRDIENVVAVIRDECTAGIHTVTVRNNEQIGGSNYMGLFDIDFCKHRIEIAKAYKTESRYKETLEAARVASKLLGFSLRTTRYYY